LSMLEQPEQVGMKIREILQQHPWNFAIPMLR
jgi:hypothetical protein